MKMIDACHLSARFAGCVRASLTPSEVLRIIAEEPAIFPAQEIAQEYNDRVYAFETHDELVSITITRKEKCL